MPKDTALPAPAPILRTAFLYTLGVFAFGFLFGAFRVLVLAPRIGPVGAVLVEVPFLLAFSALMLRWILPRIGGTWSTGRLFAMGLIAFVLLQGLETGLAGLFDAEGLGAGALRYLAGSGATDRLIGLAAQIVFAILPVVIGARYRHV